MLHIQKQAEQAAVIIIKLTAKAPKRFHALVDQSVWTSKSVALNLAEASGRIGKSKRHHYRIAHGSAEAAAFALRLLVACGTVQQASSNTALDLLGQVRAVCWKLMH
jgi:four helix bundle protein